VRSTAGFWAVDLLCRGARRRLERRADIGLPSRRDVDACSSKEACSSPTCSLVTFDLLQRGRSLEATNARLLAFGDQAELVDLATVPRRPQCGF
jgi:hypothetical protein